MMKVTFTVLRRSLLVKTPFPSLKGDDNNSKKKSKEGHKRSSSRRRRRRHHRSNKSTAEEKEQLQQQQQQQQQQLNHSCDHSSDTVVTEDTTSLADDAAGHVSPSTLMPERELHSSQESQRIHCETPSYYHSYFCDDGEDDDEDDWSYDDDSEDEDVDDEDYDSDSSSLSSCSSLRDEASIARRRQELHHELDLEGEACIDKDVQVFLEISQKLPNQSLIFLLQNHARQNMLSVIPEEALNAVLLLDDGCSHAGSTVSTSGSTSSGGGGAGTGISKKKQFRFATVANDQVRTVIHLIPRNDVVLDEELEEKDEEHLLHDVDPLRRYWWTPDEYNHCRKECAKLCRFYRK